jgi:hypothetical protein
MSTKLQVLTGTSVTTDFVTLYSPSISLLQKGSTTPVVKELARTYLYDSSNGQYVKLIYSFTLLAALLDSAPTYSGTELQLFILQIQTPAVKTGSYTVNAELQTLGSSTRSPTYETEVTTNGDSGLVYFPVTNFFSVTSPGAPYTLTITLTKDTSV